jgi:hypothetical protein
MTTTETSRILTSAAFHTALVEAGVIRDGELYRRIVIDAKEGCPVMIHAERIGDERLLKIVRTTDGIAVHYGQPAAGE